MPARTNKDRVERARRALTKASEKQPPPTGDGKLILPLVLVDIQERARAGLKKYGTMLKAYNGREALWDAYQEAIDLVMYIRQDIEERNQVLLGHQKRAQEDAS
jgi:hypothetical protein